MVGCCNVIEGGLIGPVRCVLRVRSMDGSVRRVPNLSGRGGMASMGAGARGPPGSGESGPGTGPPPPVAPRAETTEVPAGGAETRDGSVGSGGFGNWDEGGPKGRALDPASILCVISSVKVLRGPKYRESL